MELAIKVKAAMSVREAMDSPIGYVQCIGTMMRSSEGAVDRIAGTPQSPPAPPNV